MVDTSRQARQQQEESSSSDLEPLQNDTAKVSALKPEKQDGGALDKTTMEIAAMSLVVLVTIIAIPHPFHPTHNPSLQHVFYYGWLTAVSTGLGIVPLVLFKDLASYWVGVSNAVAAGMMTAASVSLIWEGSSFEEPLDKSEVAPHFRTAFGVMCGVAFILATKGILEQYEDLKFAGIDGTSAQKAILVFCVMTLHSFSEGVGIGVSFGGQHGAELGMFISASLAIHNVPEGLAIAAVLVPRGTSKMSAALWAVATSLPQPVMAVPSYMFIHSFVPIVPVGLGFAGGAMLWVALFELLHEAVEDTSIPTAGSVAVVSFATMMFIVEKIENEM